MRKRNFRFSRKAVSTMIGGIIVLALFLTALTSMIVVSQQYDSYQSIVVQMAQRDVNRYSENLAAVYPGIIVSGCTSVCTYMIQLDNLGIGTQVARIYVNTTLPGFACSSLCAIDPATTTTANTFQSSQRYINQGEVLHLVTFRVGTLGLSQTSATNTIMIVTTRGRVFSFQWPFPPVGSANQANQANIATGTMKIAYTGTWKSQSEPAFGGSGAGYCHSESGATQAFTLPGPSGTTFYFVNPWITNAIFINAFPSTGTGPSPTTVYISVNMTNTLPSGITITAGSLLIAVSASGPNAKVFFVGGNLYGEVYNGVFYSAPLPARQALFRERMSF